MSKKHENSGGSSLPPDKKRMAIMLAVNTVLLVALYYIAQGIKYVGPIVMFIYMTALAGFLIAYIIYNRAFTRKGLTPDMLSDTIPYEEKVRMIEEANQREAGSKWMLTVIIPLIFTIFIDALYIFVLSDYLKNFIK